MGRRNIPQSLVVEVLEDRRLLAGNVLATFGNGDFLIRGDTLANQIVITEPLAGTLRLTGITGTTINGQASFDVPGNADNVIIRMQQGGVDQIVILGAIDITGNLAVLLGRGSVLVDGSSGPVQIGGDLSILSSRIGDVTIRNDVEVVGDTSIETNGSVYVVAGKAALPDYKAASFSDSLNIDNPYFPLVVGTTYTYEVVELDEDGNEVVTEMIIVEVLPDTKPIDGVDTRVVLDRVFSDGLLIENTFDWYAQDDNGNIWYFGEDVTNYTYDDLGNLLSTDKDGSWVTAINGAKAGIIMEANPQVGDNYYQEFAPAVVLAPATVLDQGKVLATDETVTVPAGTFNNVLRTEDTTVVEPDSLANKFFAPGLGTIQEFDFDYLTGEVAQITRLLFAKLNGQTVTQVVPPDGFVGSNVTGPVTEGNRFLDDVYIRARDGVIVRGAEFEDSVTIRSRTDVAVIESHFADRPWIHALDAVSLRAAVSEEGFQIGGNPDVYILDSDYWADLKIRIKP